MLKNKIKEYLLDTNVITESNCNDMAKDIAEICEKETFSIEKYANMRDLVKQLGKENDKLKEQLNERLLDQLYSFEGIMGKYNCQYNGMDCQFQTAFHRLIRAEIDKLRKESNK